MQTNVKAVCVRVVAFLISLVLGLGLSLTSYTYVHRQGVFTESAFMGHSFRMKVVYALGVDVNAAGCEGRYCYNAMWGAAYGGYDDEIEFLLKRGADPNATSARLWLTPLMVAAYKGHESTVRLLLANGSNPNATIDGETALSFARQKRHSQIIEILRAAGAREETY
ncbi:MAG TPA: ankyrin repeat domain-containing protein [Pyrinomonadaceae bacterium]|nr:ankyrin repeat domain-containing protein [Pyrinomonadaceae bacterium]